MPNASDDLGYDPIDGKPSVTDSPPPYNVLPEKLKNQERFLTAIGKLPYPEVADEETTKITGRALYQFVLNFQNTPADPVAGEAHATDLTNKLYEELSKAHLEVFKDKTGKVGLYRVTPISSPFLIVFGRATIHAGPNAQAISVCWIVQNITDPETNQYQPMGDLVQIGISEEMNDLYPDLMKKVTEGEFGVDEVIRIIEETVVQPT